jgi:PAS domain S-box-containing protein
MATVLVVDDRATNRELVRSLLSYRGHQVIEAHEGSEALRLAHAQHPDLVLTDILMPGMDGYQLARALRDAPDTAETPIVFYTANYLEAEIRPFADACGIARVLLKSADPHILLHSLDEVLSQGSVTAPVDTEEVDREHLRVVSAKLFQKANALTDSEERFQLIADFSPVGVIFGDEHGSATYVNARLTKITGLPVADLLGLGWLDCANHEHHDEVLAAARGHTAPSSQHHFRDQIRLPDDSHRWLNLHLQAIRDDDTTHHGFIAIVDDVTASVEAEQQRRAVERHRDVEARNQATERLESLSRLAGGVAHDFNNILNVVLGFESFVTDSITELISTERLDNDTGQALLGDLEQIRNGGQRAAGLTQQLLTFGSRTVIHLSALDLNQAVHESLALLAPTIGGRINVVHHLAAELPPVLAEATNVAQILLNLTLNACQAMPDGGTLTIITSNTDIVDNEGSPLPPGQYVRLTIRDTGHGMTPETLDRAVEPFFTTKGRGQSAGLGLATVYGIVNQLGGTLRLESVPERGTAVTIHLPATDQPVHIPPPIRAASGGTETILVAEDEPGIRDTVTRMLVKSGYTVLTAADGIDALDLARQHPGPIHLLLSDVMMPGILGSELATRLHHQRPATKVLFMSGYAGDPMNQHGALDHDATVLAKPFTENELLTAVRARIDMTA